MADKIYSTDLWDYLGDMDYMPFRRDRDRLIEAREEKRVKIWDYFFRIDPNDVGKPQKSEISEINNSLSAMIADHNLKQQEIRSLVNKLERRLHGKQFRNLLLGIFSFLIAAIAFTVILESDIINLQSSYRCVLLPVILGILFLFSINFIGWDEKNVIEHAWKESRLATKHRDRLIKEGTARKAVLREEIKVLKRQIPPSPSADWVRDCLWEDLKSLSERSKEVTALVNILVNIDSEEYDEMGRQLIYPNPIMVIGPGELQHPDKIPPTFSKEISLDLDKHLTAKRSFYVDNENRFEVLYGVYYLENILIATDMLATDGLFYDFITGKYHAEQITEQYYQDVVAITTTHEFRKIPSRAQDQETKYVEDAPTFTLSLASGEHRTVTFASEKYFMEIRERIDVDADDVAKISWIGRHQRDADMVGKALRSKLRLHKQVLKEDK